MSKLKEKEKAIKLRKKGLSYREILKEVSVAKSTLSLWLRSVGLSKRQKQRLTKKKLIAALKGAEKRRDQRLLITKIIKEKSIKEIRKINKRDLWMIGTALYWAEGAKEREKSRLVELGNSDPYIVKIFLKWLQEICGVSKSEIHFRIYLHKTAEDRLNKIQKYWIKITNFSEGYFRKVIWKKHKIRTNRKNIGENYHGLLKITVKKSTNLNRKIAGWTEGIYKNCGVV